jgi:hypothetical protein
LLFASVKVLFSILLILLEAEARFEREEETPPFCDFCPFAAKKIVILSKTNVMINLFAKTSFSLSKKKQTISPIFWPKFKKNHTIGPWAEFDLNFGGAPKICFFLFVLPN